MPHVTNIRSLSLMPEQQRARLKHDFQQRSSDVTSNTLVTMRGSTWFLPRELC